MYNEILRYRTDAYYAAKENVSYIGANARLTALKKQPELAFLNEVSSVPLQQCLRHQQASFSNFFAGRAKIPNIQKRKMDSKRLNLLTALSLIKTAISVLQNLKPRWLFAGVVNSPAYPVLLPLPKTAQVVISSVACVSLSQYCFPLPIR